MAICTQEPIQWDGMDETADLIADMYRGPGDVAVIGGRYLEIPTPSGVMTADIGDVLAVDEKGAIYFAGGIHHPRNQAE